MLAGTRLHATRLARAAAGLRPSALRQKVKLGNERLDLLARRAERSFVFDVRRRRALLDSRAQLLASFSHKGVLQRGFTLVRDEAGKMVRTAQTVKTGAALDIEFADGHVSAKASGAPDKPGGSRSKKSAGAGTQGSLF